MTRNLLSKIAEKRKEKEKEKAENFGKFPVIATGLLSGIGTGALGHLATGSAAGGVAIGGTAAALNMARVEALRRLDTEEGSSTDAAKRGALTGAAVLAAGPVKDGVLGTLASVIARINGRQALVGSTGTGEFLKSIGKRTIIGGALGAGGALALRSAREDYRKEKH